MILITVVIPIFNTEKFLKECVLSLYRQDVKITDFEVLLIDDGSSDKSLALANDLAQDYPNIKVFHQENQGQAAARNFGIDNAKGEYITFLDSDDYLLPHSLRLLYQNIKNDDLDAVFGYWIVECINGETLKLNTRQLKGGILYTGEELALNYPVFGSMCGAIFKRDVFKDLRFKTGFTHEDSELCFRLYPKLKKVVFVDEPVYFYRYNPVSTDRSRDKSKLLKNLESDIVIASLLYEYINKETFNKNIQAKYKRIANSMVISYFIRLRNSGLLNDINIEQKVDEWRRLKVYPIKGKCLSLKSTLLSRLFNIPFILRQYLK